jgi:DNA invertase Pin-like site-specific DNA recombinase
MDGQYVAYYRVSKKSQGESGLGLEAQQRAVRDYLNGGQWSLIGEFTEVESGKNDTRPRLTEALAMAKNAGATLLIAKLDRLSRDVHFLTGLQKQQVKFVCCDMPYADQFTIHILAAVAQKEREFIVRRTNEGLDSIRAKLANGETHVSKRSGRVVERFGGTVAPTEAMVAKSVQVRSEKAKTFASTVAPTAKALKDAGLTLQNIADRLNEMKVKTSGGANWTPMAVKRVLERS